MLDSIDLVSQVLDSAGFRLFFRFCELAEPFCCKQSYLAVSPFVPLLFYVRFYFVCFHAFAGYLRQTVKLCATLRRLMGVRRFLRNANGPGKLNAPPGSRLSE